MATKKSAQTNIAPLESAAIAAPKKSSAAPRAKKHAKASVPEVETAVIKTAPAIVESPKVAAPAVAPREVTNEEIARLAFCFYMDRGGENGSAEADWLRAEQTLRGGSR